MKVAITMAKANFTFDHDHDHNSFAKRDSVNSNKTLFFAQREQQSKRDSQTGMYHSNNPYQHSL